MGEHGSYHHGDLRATLIREAVEMLASGGEAGVTLREVARRAGVSHNAPYRHFRNKEALLVAVATDGYRRLARELQGAEARSDSGQPAIRALTRAYVRFHLDHRALLETMLERRSRPVDPELDGARREAIGPLVDAAGELERVADPERTALALWASAVGAIRVIEPPDGLDRQAQTEYLVSFLDLILDSLIG